jgi:hypothetical protein
MDPGSPSYPVPACFTGLGNQVIVKSYETEDMIPHNCKKRPEGHCEQDDEGEILHDVAGHTLFEQLAKNIAPFLLAKDPVSAVCHSVRGVMELFQITEIEWMAYEITQ